MILNFAWEHKGMSILVIYFYTSILKCSHLSTDYLPVAMGQESGVSSLVPLARSLPWAIIKLSTRLHLIWRFNQGRACFQATRGPCWCSVPGRSLRWGPRLSGCWPEVSLGPCHRGLSLRTNKKMKLKREFFETQLLKWNPTTSAIFHSCKMSH